MNCPPPIDPEVNLHRARELLNQGRPRASFEETLRAIERHETREAERNNFMSKPESLKQEPTGNRISNECLALCYEIERLPASEQQTKVSIMASELRARIAALEASITLLLRLEDL